MFSYQIATLCSVNMIVFVRTNAGNDWWNDENIE